VEKGVVCMAAWNRSCSVIEHWELHEIFFLILWYIIWVCMYEGMFAALLVVAFTVDVQIEVLAMMSRWRHVPAFG